MDMTKKIEDLKEKLSLIDTEELLGEISMHFTTFADEHGGIQDEFPFQLKSELMSPQKQYIYLAGLLMSTDDKSNRKNNIKLLLTLNEDIQNITQEYIKGFIGDSELFKNDNQEKLQKHLVSMDAFISYFDTGILRYNEQTEHLIKVLYSPFDNEIKDICGLTTSDFIDFYHFVTEKMTDARNEMQNAFNEMSSFLASINPYEQDTEKLMQQYQKLLNFGLDNPNIMLKQQEGIAGNNKLKKQDILNKFGNEKGEKLLELFAIKREKRDFQYYNGDNPFASHPLCWLNQEILYAVSPQILLNAIFIQITTVLENPKNKFLKKYYKDKANTVEKEFLNCFKFIFHEEAKYHVAVCESPGTLEHDIVIEYKNYILIAEVKASKVKEPFFNPEKAYIRIRDHFFSDSGIGYAYNNQACVLKKKIESVNDIILYENMREPFEIQNTQSKCILPIVLTLNQFGGMAINTSSLLTPEEGQPYPWVCNLHDFQNLIEIWKYLRKTSDDFISYIEWRCKRHKDITASDELDIAEQYFTNPQIKETLGAIYIANNTKRCLIDKIYFEKMGLHFVDDEETIGNNIGSTIFRVGKKIYPNEPCPCGSGKKFKKCHKGKGIYD